MVNNLKDLTIALVGPIETKEFLDILQLPEGQYYPKGLGGSPVNLLAKELHRRGYNLLLCSVDPSVEDEVCLQGERLKIRFGTYGKRPARSFFTKESKWMTRILLEEKPDIIHAHWTYEFALATEATNIPYLITAHDAPLNVLKYNFIPFRIARTLMAYIAVWKAKHLSAVSPYVADHLKKYLFYRNPILVIPNGLPDSVFNRNKPIKDNSSALNFATILNGWSSYKNGEIAIKAFNIYRQTNPNSRLLMFGAGHGVGEEAEQWAKKLNINQGIEFIGNTAYNDLMSKLHNDVDILIHPSLEESFSMVAIEVISLGIPVIGGKNSGGLPWTLNSGKAGVLVDVSKPQEIADAMQELTTNIIQRGELIKTAFKHVKENFHINVVTDAYIAAYNDILKKH